MPKLPIISIPYSVINDRILYIASLAFKSHTPEEKTLMLDELKWLQKLLVDSRKPID